MDLYNQYLPGMTQAQPTNLDSDFVRLAKEERKDKQNEYNKTNEIGNFIKNRGKYFTFFIVVSSLFIVILMSVLAWVTFCNNECRHSRSNGRSKNFCYNETMHCQKDWGKTYHFIASTNYPTPSPTTSETISFGNLVVGICYGSCPPVSSECVSILYDGYHMGYCTDTQIVYLPNFGSLTGPEQETVGGQLISQMVDKIVKVDRASYPDFVGMYNSNHEFNYLTTQNSRVISSLDVQGIFGEEIFNWNVLDEHFTNELASQYLHSINKIIDKDGGFDKIDNQEQFNTLSMKFHCVDPGLVYPCNGRIWNEREHQFCRQNPTDLGPSCVKFCSHNYDQSMSKINSSNTEGLKKLIIGNEIMGYQTNGFGTKLENTGYDAAPTGTTIDEWYSYGPQKQPRTSTQLKDKTANSYKQKLVFCGGTTPGSCNNAAADPTKSRFPTPGKGTYFGF